MLGIVILIYNSKDNVISLVKQIKELCTIPYRLVIVDNTPVPQYENEILSTTNAVKVNGDYPSEERSVSCFYYPTHQNVGFAQGNNIGAEFLINNFPEIEYLLFSNDDIILHNDNILEKMCAKLSSNPQIGCLGPRIVDVNGKDQSPRKSVPPLRKWLSIYYLYPLHEIYKKLRHRLPATYVYNTAAEGKCDWLLGAFVMFPVNYFQQMKMFDPDTFLYCEEIIVSKKLKMIDKINYFYPNVVVTHLNGASTTKETPIRQAIILHKSFKVYYKKYCGNSYLSLFLYDMAFFTYMKIWTPLFRFFR